MCFPPPSLRPYRIGLGTYDALLRVSYTLQSVLECGQEARIFLVDFVQLFYRVDHQGILLKLCSVGRVSL